MKMQALIRIASSCMMLGLLALAPSTSLGQSLASTQVETTEADTLTPGVQGSVMPLSDNVPVLTGDDLIDKSFPNSWPLFGSNVRLKIGGFVKADFIHDFDYVGDRYEFELGSIAVEGSPERELGGITTFHAKQTRINFDFRSKATWKSGKEFPMRVFVEVDWFFDAEAFRLNTRLRHAYGVVGRLLIGRTWTTSVDLSAVPATIDFSAGDALYGGRLAQIRWQDRINDKFSYAVALEDAGGQIGNPGNIEGAFRPTLPNLAGMIKYRSKAGSSIQLGVDVFGLRWAGPTTVPNETKVGAALSVSSRILLSVSEYKDAFVWAGGIGEGQGHKIIALSWDGRASGVVTQDELSLATSWWALVGYNHYWSKTLNSNISTAWAGTSLSDEQPDGTIEQAGSFHVNLIWFPYPKISTGIEYMWGMRRNKSGVEGTASRIQFMGKFIFN